MIKHLFHILILVLGLYTTSSNAGFTAGTLVHTIRGLVPIEQVTLTDHVYCVDKNNNQTQRPIVATSCYKTNNLYNIYFDNTIITCDANQLFYIPAKKVWKKAQSITPTQSLLVSNGEYITVTSSKLIEHSEYMYDLSIQDCPNFFVSEHKILVHNFVLTIPLIAFGGGEIVFLTGAAIKAVVGGILGGVFWNFLQKSSGASTTGGPAPISFDQATSPEAGAQAPGIPTENEDSSLKKIGMGKNNHTQKMVKLGGLTRKDIFGCQPVPDQMHMEDLIGMFKIKKAMEEMFTLEEKYDYENKYYSYM